MKCKYCGAEVDLWQKCEYCGSRAEPPGLKITIQEKPETPKKEYKTVNGIYTVRKGDTLWGIAKALLGSGTRYTEIAKKNRLKDPNFIYPGQKLEI